MKLTYLMFALAGVALVVIGGSSSFSGDLLVCMIGGGQVGWALAGLME